MNQSQPNQKLRNPPATSRVLSTMWFVAITSIVLAGCWDDPARPSEPTDPPYARSTDVALQDADVQEFFPAEQVFIDIASRGPAFAGTFVEGNVLVVNVSDPDRRDAVADAVRDLLLPEMQRHGRAMGGIETRDVRYSFLELANERNLAWRDVMSLEGVTSLDVDERGNRIHIGLTTEGGRTRVEQVLESLGIPSEATVIEVVGPAVPTASIDETALSPLPVTESLSSRVRPIPGGVSFGWTNGSYNSGCTLGFHVRIWPGGDYHFITNSHCTYEVYGLDAGSTYSFQTDAPDTIGSESTDPEPWNCTWPWEPRECRYSDAAAHAYRPGIIDSLDFGTIARPKGPPGTGSNLGNTEIDPNNPRFYIEGSVNWPQQGDSVHKVGYIGGWTKGEVYATCTGVNISSGSHYPSFRVTCAYRGDYAADDGDSGGTVFMRQGTTNAILAGVNFGKDTEDTPGNGIFSSFGAILENSHDDLFSRVQVWNAPLQGGITGPPEVPPETECTWSASNVSGGVWPYTYQWSGALSGTGMNVTGTIQAPGEWLYLTVTDDASNQVSDQLFISVDEQVTECRY